MIQRVATVSINWGFSLDVTKNENFKYGNWLIWALHWIGLDNNTLYNLPCDGSREYMLLSTQQMPGAHKNVRVFDWKLTLYRLVQYVLGLFW